MFKKINLLFCRRNVATFKNILCIVCLNSEFPSTLYSTLEIQPATLFGEKCVRLHLLGYLSISVFTNQNFRIEGKNEIFF
jgi:hypothetical protein